MLGTKLCSAMGKPKGECEDGVPKRIYEKKNILRAKAPSCLWVATILFQRAAQRASRLPGYSSANQSIALPRRWQRMPKWTVCNQSPTKLYLLIPAVCQRQCPSSRKDLSGLSRVARQGASSETCLKFNSLSFCLALQSQQKINCVEVFQAKDIARIFHVRGDHV